MKRLYLSAALLAFLLAASLYVSSWVSNFSQGLVTQLEEAMTLTQQNNWPQAREKTVQTFQQWQDRAFVLHIFLRHSNTDEILLSFHSVNQYLLLEEADQYTAANAQLICQLELLAEMEQPSLQNIL